ncbi:adenosine deaminase [Lentilitoribacter sp. EG35]
MMKHIPKAELHCHIEGAVVPELAIQQAIKYQTDISDILDGDHYKWHDFTSFLKAYDTVANLFRSEEDYAQLAETYLNSIAQTGAIYSEIFISPDHAMAAGLPPKAYISGLAEGIRRAEANTGIICRMIIVGVRHLGAENVEKAAILAASRPHELITGFGMAGDERFGKVKDFARAFDIARDADLGITIHAGELDGAHSVRDAVTHIKPTRIGHGVRAIEDMDLVKEIADKQIVLETCPGSNISLSVFPSLAAHPFKKLKDAGAIVTISSDDPPYFKTSLSKDYENIASTFGFGDNEMVGFTKNAIHAAFVEDKIKDKLLAQLGFNT